MLSDFDFINGETLLIDKPLDWTSFDVVGKVRNLLKDKYGKRLKVGHAGTLDPRATGLLILCTGKKTKTIQFIQKEEKEYIGTFEIGGQTPTYDTESEVSDRSEWEHLTKEEILEKAASFKGWIEQIPPIHSAVKVDGKRAYELARAGKSPELKAREVFIENFEVGLENLPEIEFNVRCSKGTYIRSLAHDLGAKLGCGAYLKTLRRTKIGDYDVKDALNMEQIELIIKSL